MKIKKNIKEIISLFFAYYLKSKGVVCGDGLILVSPPMIRKHKKSQIIIGRQCQINNSSYFNIAGIYHKTIISTISANASVIIGNAVGLSGNIIVASKSIKIGNNVFLGANAKIYDTDFHPLNLIDRINDVKENIISKEIYISDGVWIGADSIILKGVSIGRNSIIGAGSVVTKSVPDNCIFAGNPAKFIRNI